MKSLAWRGSSANINMKGKKTLSMGCGCCVLEDLRDKAILAEHRKEMKRAIKETTGRDPSETVII